MIIVKTPRNKWVYPDSCNKLSDKEIKFKAFRSEAKALFQDMGRNSERKIRMHFKKYINDFIDAMSEEALLNFYNNDLHLDQYEIVRN